MHHGRVSKKGHDRDAVMLLPARKAGYPLWWLKQAANYSSGQAVFSVG